MKRIRIAAALIENGEGEMLLVRKAGTHAFMQAGGKIEAEEAPAEALARELAEELNWTGEIGAVYLGKFSAEAANEPDCMVEAELFRLRARGAMQPSAELDAAVWVDPGAARGLSLAPLTRDYVLPLFEQFLRDGA